uniref:Putative aquaporin aqpcic-like protein n=1 Tax=Haematobia irritans TaxID=7368 RepID=A0A1L8EAI5_HAEIR
MWDRLSWFLAEFIGTSMLMLFGCMGCMDTEIFPSNNLTRSLNFGLVVLVIVQCFACCSGAHFNPAVSLAAYIYDILSLPMTLAYVSAQILGAYCGYGLLIVFLPANVIQVPGGSSGLCVTGVNAEIDVWQGLGIEICITMALVFVCCSVWDPRNKHQQDSVALRFGFAVACLSITAGPITGASMNPARSLGPAIWHNDFRNHWIYWIGPLSAAIIASSIYKFLFRREVPEEKETGLSKINEVQCT